MKILPLALGLAALSGLIPMLLAQNAPSLEVRVAPAPVPADDGNVYLLYELHLRDVGPTPIERLEVIDLDDPEQRTLVSFDREELRPLVFDFIIDYDRHFYYDSLGRAMSFHLGEGRDRMAYLTVTLASGDELPRRLGHRAVLDHGDDLEIVEGGETVIAPPPPVLGAPVRGEDWIAAGTLAAIPAPHRLSLVRYRDEVAIHDRYAIDFFLADASGAARTGDGTRNADFHAWGQPVYATAAGTVVAALDGVADNEKPGAPRSIELTPETLGGNHVILDLGDERYAVYAHLQHGSVQVRAGERVVAGAQIGRVGNSGNSHEPHLHFAFADRPSVVAGEGLPFVFERIRTDGECGYTASGWTCTDDEPSALISGLPRRARRVDLAPVSEIRR